MAGLGPEKSGETNRDLDGLLCSGLDKKGRVREGKGKGAARAHYSLQALRAFGSVGDVVVASTGPWLLLSTVAGPPCCASVAVPVAAMGSASWCPAADMIRRTSCVSASRLYACVYSAMLCSALAGLSLHSRRCVSGNVRALAGWLGKTGKVRKQVGKFGGGPSSPEMGAPIKSSQPQSPGFAAVDRSSYRVQPEQRRTEDRVSVGTLLLLLFCLCLCLCLCMCH